MYEGKMKSMKLNQERYKSNEKVVSARLTRQDLSDYYELTKNNDVKPIDIFRVGLRTMIKNKKCSNETRLLSMKKMIEDRQYERELDNLADDILLERINEKLEYYHSFNKVKQMKLIDGILDLHESFKVDGRYDWDTRNSLSMFYTCCRDSISIVAMKCGTDYDGAVELYDRYVEYSVSVGGDGSDLLDVNTF